MSLLNTRFEIPEIVHDQTDNECQDSKHKGNFTDSKPQNQRYTTTDLQDDGYAQEKKEQESYRVLTYK